MQERRQLLKLVFQNLTIDGKKVRIQAQKPFDTIFKYANNLSWGQLVNDVRSWWNDDRNENERQILKAVLLSDVVCNFHKSTC